MGPIVVVTGNERKPHQEELFLLVHLNLFQQTFLNQLSGRNAAQLEVKQPYLQYGLVRLIINFIKPGTAQLQNYPAFFLKAANFNRLQHLFSRGGRITAQQHTAADQKQDYNLLGSQ